MTMKTDRAYGIRHKQTKEIWKTPKGKKVWSRIAHAKNAWNNGNSYSTLESYGITLEREGPYNHVVSGNLFHQQDVFEIFEYGTEYSEALQLLKDVIDSKALDHDSQLRPLREVIWEFLVSKKVV